jgi:hypothetical protein
MHRSASAPPAGFGCRLGGTYFLYEVPTVVGGAGDSDQCAGAASLSTMRKPALSRTEEVTGDASLP